MAENIIGEITPPAWLGKHGDISVDQQTGKGFGLINFFSNMLRLAIIVAGLFALVNLIIAGYGILTAGGDAEKMSTAQSKIWNSLYGLIIIAASFTLIAIFSFLLYGDASLILNPKIFGPGQ